MAGSLSTVLLLLAVFTLSSALSQSFSKRVSADDEDIFQRPVPKPLKYPGKVLDVEDKELQELAEDSMRVRERERERERLRRLEREREREREELKLRNELRRERERERERKGRHETRRMTGDNGFSPDSVISVISENIPTSKDQSRGLRGKHRGREEEIEKERTDHHGRKEKERIHKMERERLRQRKIHGQMRKELEKEMRGHRQRLMKVGNKFREQEERFRARSRARGASLRT